MRKIALLIIVVLALALTPTISAGTTTETYLKATATITTPDTAEPNTNFPINYTGTLLEGNSWSVFAWGLYEGGTCNDPTVNSCTGTKLAGSGFAWGNSISGTYTTSKAEGSYTYWFCMGDRRWGHGWYDVCVSSQVNVQPAEPCKPADFENHGQYLSCIAKWRNENVDPGDRAGGEPVSTVAKGDGGKK